MDSEEKYLLTFSQGNMTICAFPIVPDKEIIVSLNLLDLEEGVRVKLERAQR